MTYKQKQWIQKSTEEQLTINREMRVAIGEAKARGMYAAQLALEGSPNATSQSVRAASRGLDAIGRE